MKAPVICWIRRDIRSTDHRALYEALKSGHPVCPVFVFDEHIIAPLREKKSGNQDRRLTFIISALVDLNQKFMSHDSSLEILYGDPVIEIPHFAQKIKACAVYTCEDYEPYARERDEKVERELAGLDIKFHSYKDHVVLGPREVLKDDDTIYKVFTSYKRKWLETFLENGRTLEHYPCNLDGLMKREVEDHDVLEIHENLGFELVDTPFKGSRHEALMRLHYFEANILGSYQETRDLPGQDGTSMLSCYIRHGLLSIRELFNLVVSKRGAGEECWMSELIWREFYQMLLANRPELTQSAFKREYDRIKWHGDSTLFKKWQQGQTGFPIVDAAMRCLAQTGLMPNRLRMVCASFLCKTLLVDWRLGEAHFAKLLFDFDLAANNGGWQWCASCGVDAQPYFRIFNPYNQSEKFDSKGEFIKRWCPELAFVEDKFIHDPSLMTPLEQEMCGCRIGVEYPAPIVDYKLKRDEAMSMYKAAIKPS